MRILKWLRENEIPLGALTSHDTTCLLASVEIAGVWTRGDLTNRRDAARAFKLIVQQMQVTTQFMSYHGTAMVADWSHRQELWMESGLSKDVLVNKPDCKFAPLGNQPAANPTGNRF